MKTCNWHGAAVTWCALLLVQAQIARAAGVVGTGTPQSCTNAALDAALDGGGLVTFDCGPSLVTIDSGNMVISTDTTIDGKGVVTISGGNLVQVFSIRPGVNVVLNGLTIADAGYFLSGGIGIFNDGGTLTVAGCTFTRNANAGISSQSGTLTVAESTFSDTHTGILDEGGRLTISNSAFSDNEGGGILAEGSALTVTGSTFTNNRGGILSSSTPNNSGSATIAGCMFRGNSFFGGIVNSGVPLTVINSAFTGNSTVDGRGGAGIQHGSTFRQKMALLTVANSTFADNLGGGIALGDSTGTIRDSTFTRNVTFSAGAGIASYGSSLTIINSTFRGNVGVNLPPTCGGAISASGTLTVANSTLTENEAALGAGICSDGELTVTNSTITGNRAYNNGGGIISFSRSALVRNTIISSSTCLFSANGFDCNCGSPVTDGGHNIEDGTACGFSAANDSVSDTDPRLSLPLADNGGPTQTIALLDSSPAVGAGDPEVCAAPPVNGLDQRGYVRPGLGSINCSIGAYERDSSGPPGSTTATPPAAEGTPTASPSASATTVTSPGAECLGDCNGDGEVTIDEIVAMTNIALGVLPMGACAGADQNGEGRVTVDEIITAVNIALNGCG